MDLATLGYELPAQERSVFGRLCGDCWARYHSEESHGDCAWPKLSVSPSTDDNHIEQAVFPLHRSILDIKCSADFFSHVFLSVCIGDGPDYGRPYVVCRFRDVDSQECIECFLSPKLMLLKPLPFAAIDTAAQEEKQKLRGGLVEAILQQSISLTSASEAKKVLQLYGYDQDT